MTHALVLATSNHGKVEEFRALLAGLPLVIHTAKEVLPHSPSIIEDGATFVDNARIKARAIARAATMLALADDSGLEVDALGGAPGVRSARYAGDRATDAENNAALLRALGERGDPSAPTRYPARFRCALVVVDPFREDHELVAEAACEGFVTRTPRGSGGFGYDPLFLVGNGERTMAELDESEKNTVSHRARAFAELRPALARLLAERDAQIARIVGR